MWPCSDELERGGNATMKNTLKIVSIILFSFLLLIGCSSSASPNTENKATAEDSETELENNEQTKREDDEEHRIISTTVAIVEIIEELDLDLVGIPTTYKELSPRYNDLPDVGIANEPDMEIVMSLKPTDVLSVTTLQDEVEGFYNSTNTPVTFLNLESVDGMLESIELLGEKYNREEEANALVERFNNTFAEIEAKIAGKEKPKVLILLGVPGSYLVATENSYLGDIAKRAGAENVFPGEDGVEYTAANTEYLQQTNADIILRAAHGMPDEVVKMFDKEFKENDIWKHFDAVKNGRVYDLEETLFGTTANIRADQALQHLVEIFYPEE